MILFKIDEPDYRRAAKGGLSVKESCKMIEIIADGFTSVVALGCLDRFGGEESNLDVV
ncbi:MAG: hypothetical protein GY774_03415 [Planctomycetes bacterium]|nr:hypothetical protein [Planctomycetota bacterium]